MNIVIVFWLLNLVQKNCNRPAPPLPHLYLSEEMVNEAACFIRSHINTLLSVSEDIALGKDTNMFVKVSGGLLLVSILGGLTDFLTLGYTSKLLPLFLVLEKSVLDDRN